MNDFVKKYGLIDLLRTLRLILFILAGLFLLVDGVVLWPFYVLLCLLLPKTLGRILSVNLYSKRFGVEDVYFAIYVLAHFGFFYLAIRKDAFEGVLQAVEAIRQF